MKIMIRTMMIDEDEAGVGALLAQVAALSLSSAEKIFTLAICEYVNMSICEYTPDNCSGAPRLSGDFL